MRAVIVELRGAKAAALAQDGTVYRVPNRKYVLGQQVDLNLHRPKRLRRTVAWAACVAVLCSMATVSVYAVYDPYSYVSVDTETSVEYTLNRFDQVIEVRSADDQSEALAAELDEELPPFTHIDEALDRTIGRFYEDGYLTGADGDRMVIAVSAKRDNKANGLKEHLGTRVGEARDGEHKAPPTEIVRVSREEHRKMLEDGRTPQDKPEEQPDAAPIVTQTVSKKTVESVPRSF